MNHSPQITIVAPPRVNACTKLRRTYFAQGEAAARYHVAFDQLIRHLWSVRRNHRRLRLSQVACLEDLIHAIGCVANNDLAWADLAERHERALVRRCRGNQNEIEAIISVRRMFADLRQRTCHGTSVTALDVRSFWGDRPLRTWLADRLSAILARGAIDQARQQHGVRRDHCRGHADPSATPLRYDAWPGSRAG